jgi:hypothetical protein
VRRRSAAELGVLRGLQQLVVEREIPLSAQAVELD